jgi:hypothetical protein
MLVDLTLALQVLQTGLGKGIGPVSWLWGLNVTTRVRIIHSLW